MLTSRTKPGEPTMYRDRYNRERAATIETWSVDLGEAGA